ncbi:serine hydrolase [uncultured Tenacibaculum sp.]|uniref:serine hydrolase n=1 Tax=uncultured Tenacibaculum sp. TaxID=174713 RepID=UPI00262C729C|nr:serine hydrolase [uncultured Tenacibaculum sp.]
MKKTFFLFAIIGILQTSSFELNAQETTQPTSLFSKIDNYLTAGTKNGFSGAITVVRNGVTIINKGYGIANKETNTGINSNTIFDIGSNTKQFTATAILKLAELDKLKLTDSLNTFFKDLSVDKQSITVHQLLTHSAGFVDALGRDFTQISQKDFFDKVFSSTLLSKPGEKYSYSNVGYSILGRIIELTSGLPYETFLNKHLFIPAGMRQTGYLLPKWNVKEISNSYNRGIIKSESPIFHYKKDKGVNWHLKANGGINSTQNDMLLWFKALKTNKILSEESFKKLITPYIHYSRGKYKYAYAYGWGVRILDNNIKRIAHNGSNGAYSHSLIWFPKKDIYIIYATNANSSKVEFTAYSIAKMILDSKYVPKPIQNNVFSFIFNYTKQHPTNKHKELLAILKEKYSSDFTHAGVLNTIGNLILKSNKNLDWALNLFKSNVQLFPKDGNLWDSLGDGYMANNLQKNAIKSYRKAIELGYTNSQEKLDKLNKN